MERIPLSDPRSSFARDTLNVNLNFVLSEPARETRVSGCDWLTVAGCLRRGGRVRTHLVKRNVVLDVVRLFFGFGVIPCDVLDEFPVDSGVVISGSSERGYREVSLSGGSGAGLGGPFPRTDSAVYPRGER